MWSVSQSAVSSNMRLNTIEKIVCSLSLLSWLVGVAAGPIAIISEHNDPTTARAEAAMGGAAAFALLLFLAFILSIVSLILSLVARKTIKRGCFWFGMSPFAAFILLSVIVLFAFRKEILSEYEY